MPRVRSAHVHKQGEGYRFNSEGDYWLDGDAFAVGDSVSRAIPAKVDVKVVQGDFVVNSEPRRDPEKAERSFLRRHTSQPVGRVLDIGCGDGRLTWYYARKADLVAGIDVEMEDLRSAISARPGAVSAKVCFAAAAGGAIPFVDELFNLALFSWSL